VLKTIRSVTTSARYQPPGSGNYFFRAIACREPGPECSKPGNIVEVAVSSPPTPTLWPLDPVKANTLFEITWQGVPGCELYEFEESIASDFPVGKTKKGKVYHPGQKLTHKGHLPGRYYYRVRAVAHDGTPGDWSNVLVVDVS
jgi:hypothetical protein